MHIISVFAFPTDYKYIMIAIYFRLESMHLYAE